MASDEMVKGMLDSLYRNNPEAFEMWAEDRDDVSLELY